MLDGVLIARFDTVLGEHVVVLECHCSFARVFGIWKMRHRQFDVDVIVSTSHVLNRQDTIR